MSGSALVRLVAQLAGADAREAARPLFSDQLIQWLGWTDAIALSGALEGQIAAAPPGTPAAAGPDKEECTRVRTALARGITEPDTPVSARPRGHLPPAAGGPADLPADFAPHRQRYLARQQAMEAAIAALRARLRAALAARSPALARLAAVDAVMAQVLAPREHALLSALPALLERHFLRLREAHGARAEVEAGVEAKAAGNARPWLDVFRRDMQAVLLAELDLRFQPVEGLADALSCAPSPMKP